MIGWDFLNFWNIGEAVLKGADPYSMPYSFYPPATLYLFSVFGWIPYLVAYALWVAIGVVFFIDIFRRMPKENGNVWPWFLFAPVLFTLMTGQLEILFFWIASRMKERGWKAILFSALLTLKPQIALIVLPWYLFQWLRHDRRQLLRWGAVTLVIQTWPLFIDPLAFSKWFSSNADDLSWRLLNSPGIFVLSNWNIPIVVMAVIAMALAAWGIFQSQQISRTACLLSLPMGMWYQGVLLTGSVPWQLAVPMSWVAFGLASLLRSAVPLALIPLVIFSWQAWIQKRRSTKTPSASCAL